MAFEDLESQPDNGRAVRTRPAARLAFWVRWVHVYLSMLGFAALFFFSATGITLNHAEWFYGDRERTVDHRGEVPVAWVRESEPVPTPVRNDPGYDPKREVAALEIVEHLRKEHGVRGALGEFTVDEYECLVSFKGPGYSADAFIDRETGEYSMTESSFGFVAVINDLHKGRETGGAWSWVIDVSAGLLCLVAASGFGLLFYLKKRRRAGLLIAVIGTLALTVVYVAWVP